MAAHRGDPNAGHYTLTRQVDNEEEEQFDVDLTIQDFLTYKATESLFEWRESSNPYQSDLPDALLTMTAGMYPDPLSIHAGRDGHRAVFVFDCNSIRNPLTSHNPGLFRRHPIRKFRC